MTEDDEKLMFDFQTPLLHFINDRFVLKDLINNYPDKVLDDLKRRIQFFSPDFNELTNNLHFFENFLNLTTVFLDWSIKIFIASNKDNEVKKLINKIISNSNWEDYNDFKDPFLDYFTSLNEIIPLCKSQDEILDKYKLLVLKLVQKIPKRIIRAGESKDIHNRAIELISLFQVIGESETKKLRFNIEQILKETDKILKINKDPVTMYMIINTRTFLLEQFSIITQDKKVFYRAYKESLKGVEFIEKNHKKIKSICPYLSLSEDDIVLNLNNIGYLCFCHQEFDKLREIREKINQTMKVSKISTFTKIGINHMNFILEEDYESLNDIYRLSRTYITGQFKIRDDSSVLTACAFAEAFFSDNIGSKSKLYDKAIFLNKNSHVTSVSLQKDVSQITALDQILQLFYHLDMCRLQDSPYTFISELKTSFKIAEKNISNELPFESLMYFFLKTKIISLFVEGKYKEIQTEMGKINKFDFNQCKEFQRFVNKAIISMKKNYDEKLLDLVTIKETKDLWIQVLIKYLQQSAERDYIEEFEQKNKEFSRIKDMKILLEKFKIIILDGAVKSFWAKKYKKLNTNPEDIGRSHLIVFLRALNKFELTRESEVNYYFMDIFILDKLDVDKAYIIETKVCRDQPTFDKGIEQITKKYLKYRKGLNEKLEAFYVVFDSRKKYPEIPSEVNTSEGKIKIIHIPINREV